MSQFCLHDHVLVVDDDFPEWIGLRGVITRVIKQPIKKDGTLAKAASHPYEVSFYENYVEVARRWFSAKELEHIEDSGNR